LRAYLELNMLLQSLTGQRISSGHRFRFFNFPFDKSSLAE